MHNVISFFNDLNVASDGWAQLAPFGEFPATTLVNQADGTTRIVSATQRLDRQAALTLHSRFTAPVHIYAGHPDCPSLSSQYPDKEPKGAVAALEVRDDGLWCRPVFNNAGVALVDSRSGLALSGRWESEPVANFENVFRPCLLKSVAITDKPNLDVEFFNAGQPVQFANAAQRSETVRDLVNAEMRLTRCSYDEAFARVRRNHPALFAAMKQPDFLSSKF